MKISEYKNVKRKKDSTNRGFSRPDDAPRDSKHRDKTKYRRKQKHKTRDE